MIFEVERAQYLPSSVDEKLPHRQDPSALEDSKKEKVTVQDWGSE